MSKKKTVLIIIITLVVGLGFGIGIGVGISAGLQQGNSTATVLQETSGKCGDNIEWSYEESNKTLYIEGTGDMYDYTLKTEPWQQPFLDVETVIISEGITSIGDHDFEMLCTLKYAYIGKDVKSIGDYAFSMCWSLEYAMIPPSVTELGFRAFSFTRDLERISLSNNLTKIGQYALETDSTKLELIIFCGTEEELKAMPLQYEKADDNLLIIYHDYQDGVCKICGAEEAES